MLGSIEVLLSGENSLLEQVFIDGDSVLLGHQHDETFLTFLLLKYLYGVESW